MFDAKDVDFSRIEEDPADDFTEGSAAGRGFAVGGGVAAAVVELAKEIAPDRHINTDYGDGLKECRKMLMLARAGQRNGYLLEGMACPGGCVAGAGTIAPVMNSMANIRKYKAAAPKKTALESTFQDRLEEVLELEK